MQFYDFRKSGVIFMRIKEEFLVPHWRVKDIFGARYDGYYYAILEAFSGKLEGFYHFNDTPREDFGIQTLKLEHVNSEASDAFQFN